MNLEEIEAIKQLKARYFRLLDTKQWDGWGDVFTEDAVLEHPANRSTPLRGRAEIVATVSAGLADRVTIHHGHMPEIEITGEAQAKGIWAMYDLLIKPLPDGNGEGRYEGYGHYLERYEKGADGRWRIARLHLRRLHLEVEQHKRDVSLEAFEEWERA
jgi:ketosteroid isomerase-like protein